jgi:uncharacterized membrane protein YwzB
MHINSYALLLQWHFYRKQSITLDIFTIEEYITQSALIMI